MSSTSGYRLATVFSVIMVAGLFFGPLNPREAHGQTVLGNWYDDNGNPISLPQATWNAFCVEGQVGYSLDGSVSITGLVGHLTFNAGLNNTIPTGGTASWSNPFVWDQPIIPIAWVENSWENLLSGGIFGYSTSSGASNVTLDSFNTLINGGPTQTSVTVPLPGLSELLPNLTVNVGTTVRFNVSIDGQRTALLDQSATLDSLSVAASSVVACQPGSSLVLGTGTSQNAGTITGANLTIQSGASLTNLGNLMLTGGGVGGQLTNQGAMSISGTGNPTIGYCTDYNSGAVAQGTVTNAGTITHAAGTTLGIGNGSTINNLAGAVYDIQSNAQISGFSYASWPAWPFSAYSSGGAINNAGLFIKSGTGTASVSNTYFNNTGTVEVDGGILSIGMGTSTNGSYVFSNGGQGAGFCGLAR